MVTAKSVDIIFVGGEMEQEKAENFIKNLERKGIKQKKMIDTVEQFKGKIAPEALDDILDGKMTLAQLKCKYPRISRNPALIVALMGLLKIQGMGADEDMKKAKLLLKGGK